MDASSRPVGGEPGDLVDAADHGQIVGHELVEVDIDGPRCRQEVALVDARPQHALQTIHPVGGDAGGVDPVLGEAGGVGRAW